MGLITPQIRKLIEREKRCGYIEINAVYVLSGLLGEPCGALPMKIPEINKCECGRELPAYFQLRFNRGLTEINPSLLFPKHDGKCLGGTKPCGCNSTCFCCNPPASPEDGSYGHFLMWVGNKYYPVKRDEEGNPVEDSFTREALAGLVCKRTGDRLPRRMVPFKTIIYLARENFMHDPTNGDIDTRTLQAGWINCVILAFVVQAIIYTVTKAQSEDPDFMKAIQEKGLTPFVLNDDYPSIAMTNRGRKARNHKTNKKTKDLQKILAPKTSA